MHTLKKMVAPTSLSLIIIAAAVFLSLQSSSLSSAAAAFVLQQHRFTTSGPALLATTTTTTTAKSDPASSSSTTTTTTSSWQDDADKLLDPTTPPSKRQQLLSNLMKQNSNIRASVQQALRDGTIDPLLTPTGRRVQEGTQTVARQIVQDILPNLFTTKPPKPEDVLNTNQRIFQSVTTQLQQTLETMASDLADPISRIPARIRHQTEAVASTVLTSTPVDLTEPPHQVMAVYNNNEYEVREYDEYDVACTTMDDSVAVAYQRLAAYISGANAEHKVIPDVPVSMRTSGQELRFYVPTKLPRPLTEDAGIHRLVDGAHKIRIETIPAATLAVRRFTGFCTEGEIQRQKELLLNSLKKRKNVLLDDNDDYEDSSSQSMVELDVPHGQTVGHLVFEYNPPVAVPIVRRNEIAVPVFFTKNTKNMDYA